MRHIGAALVITTLALVLVTCSESVPGPDLSGPGWLSLSMESPRTDDGGVLITVTGGQIDSVRSSYSDLFTTTTSQSARIIVSGHLVAGIVAEVFVPDLGQLARYSVVLNEVAARTFEQRDPAGYSVKVRASN